VIKSHAEIKFRSPCLYFSPNRTYY